jgi:hypothetical protein
MATPKKKRDPVDQLAESLISSQEVPPNRLTRVTLEDERGVSEQDIPTNTVDSFSRDPRFRGTSQEVHPMDLMTVTIREGAGTREVQIPKSTLGSFSKDPRFVGTSDEVPAHSLKKVIIQDGGKPRAVDVPTSSLEAFKQDPRFVGMAGDRTTLPTAQPGAWSPPEDYGKPAPTLPPGRTPFIVGDATHEAGAPPAKQNALEEYLARAAGMSKPLAGATVQPPPAPMPAPSPKVAQKPAPRPAVDVRAAGQVETSSLRSGPLARSQAPSRPVQLPPRVQQFMERRRNPDLEKAQAKAGVNRLVAGTLGASEKILSGLAGVRSDPSSSQRLMAQADQPVQDYQQQAEEDRALEEASARAAEAARRAGLDESRLDLDRQRLSQDAEQFTAQQRGAAAERAMRREELNLRRKEGDDAKNERARLAREAKASEASEKDLQKLADRTKDAAALKDDLETVLPYVNGTGDIPGVGPVVSALPEFFLSAEGTNVRQAAIRLYRGIVRAESGQTVTPQEAETAMEGMGMGKGRSEEAFRLGFAALARRGQAALKNAEAGFRPAVVDERRARGGVTSAEIPQAQRGPQPTGRTAILNGEVYEELSDGSSRRVR